ncbi:hypothetical protein [Nostoc sp. C052]|nr:hypothetical protein [Nostoc sp. C052]
MTIINQNSHIDTAREFVNRYYAAISHNQPTIVVNTAKPLNDHFDLMQV